jgi:hyperosmotically inducible protein
MRRLISLTLVVALAAIFAACGDASNTNTKNGTTNLGTNNPNSNIVVVNNNGNANTGAINSNSGNSNRWNTNISKEEYEKGKDNYGKEKRSTETIGSGATDGWLWFKTRSALATTADLRDSTIDVDVNNGAITLKGTVATAEQKKRAVEVANGIEGKTGAVKDQITVKKDDSALNSTTDSDKKASPTPKK